MSCPPTSFAAAFFLDLIIGDPETPLHPVRIMGRFINSGVEFFRRKGWITTTHSFFFYTVTTIIFTIPAIIIEKLPLAGTVISIILSSLLLSTKSLFKETENVFRELKLGNIHAARKKLSLLVTRETGEMGYIDLSRTTVETLAENFVDGILSPLFYLAVWGLPGLVLFKVTSTMDSMIGYKEGYLSSFGKIPARMDDALNYVPARISAILVFISSLIAGFPWKRVAEGIRKDKGKTDSPNSWIPESAVSNAVGIMVGGPRVYHGKPLKKPYMGTSRGREEPERIRDAMLILYISTAIFFLLLLSFTYFFSHQ